MYLEGLDSLENLVYPRALLFLEDLENLENLEDLRVP